MKMTYIIFIIILISPQRKRHRSSLIQLNSLVFGLIYLKCAQVCFEYSTDLFAGDGAWCESTRLSAIVGNSESIFSGHAWWHRCWFGLQSTTRTRIRFMSGFVFGRVCRRTTEQYMDPEATSCYPIEHADKSLVAIGYNLHGMLLFRINHTWIGVLRRFHCQIPLITDLCIMSRMKRARYAQQNVHIHCFLLRLHLEIIQVR